MKIENDFKSGVFVSFAIACIGTIIGLTLDNKSLPDRCQHNCVAASISNNAEHDFPPRKPPIVIDGCKMQGVSYPALLRIEDL